MRKACYAIGGALILSGLFHLVVFAIDGGPWEGPVGWRKAITFGLSFGITLISVTWVTSYLRIKPVLLWIFAVDCVAEVAGITIQAWRHVPSHFNMETPFNRGIAMMLAFGGAVLIATLVTFAIAAFRGNPALDPSMQLALRAGFATLLIGLASGAIMIARGVTLVNTGHQQLAYELGGFLKPLHFVSLHGVLVLPLVAAITKSVTLTRLAVGAYALAIVGALVVSLVG
jgi:hypothetical protein